MKRALYLLFVVMLAFGLTGCDFPGQEEDDLELTEEDIRSAADNNSALSASGGSVSAIKTLSIYTIDGIEETLVPLNVPISTDRITPEFVLDEVLRNLDEKVEVTEIDIEKARIYVTFNSDYAPVKKCSKEYETLLLDCISNSLLDNISYIDEVVFRCDKGAYQSDNFHFEEDEVYSSK